MDSRAWQPLHSSLHPIQNEREYAVTLEFMSGLMKQYDTTQEPFKGLWNLAAGYVQAWEQANDPWLKDPPTGRDALAYLISKRGVTQYQLAKAGIAHQSTLLSILRGQRGISVGVARKLATFFGVPMELFL
jgi:antitoxin component HigA of HigAB toxin-antitoxin module